MYMVEVFKTNVNSREHAHMLLRRMQRIHADYKANFDLEDCDRILRVECISGTVSPSVVINLLKKWGFDGEVLTDEVTIAHV
jgi:hypothetical protein